jgi:tetrahydromethanopterin S-methyltransferase subunit F
MVDLDKLKEDVAKAEAEVQIAVNQAINTVSGFAKDVVEAVKDEAELIEHNAKDFVGIEENCEETEGHTDGKI